MSLGTYPRPEDVSPRAWSDGLYRVSSASYPDGGVRLTAVRTGGTPKGEAPFCSEGVARCAFDFGRIKRNLDNERRKVSRARGEVADAVRCNGLDHLVTFTAGKHPRSRGHALDLMSGYLDDPRHGRWFRDHLRRCYVFVAEPFGDGNGWHVHLCMRGRLPGVALLRLKETWTRYLVVQHGIPRPENVRHRQWRVNVQPPRRHDTPRSLGCYVGKYVGKSFDAHTLPGEHRYRLGHGMLGPVRVSEVRRLSVADLLALFEGFPPLVQIAHPVSGDCLGWTSERRC